MLYRLQYPTNRRKNHGLRFRCGRYHYWYRAGVPDPRAADGYHHAGGQDLRLNAKKKAAKTAAQAPAAKPAAAPVQQAAPAPQVEEGIPGDVVAAIMAAIHAMGNGKYTLKAVRRGKNGWGKAGVNDTTAPF